MNTKEQEESSPHAKEHPEKEQAHEHAHGHTHKGVREGHKDEKKSKEQTLQEQVLELTDTLKHVQADFENYKKRTERDQEAFVAYASENTVKKFIPILDHLELALAHANHEDEFCKGVHMIFHSMMKVLEDLGVTTIDTTGSFDPRLHQAISTEEGKEKNVIVKEVQKGYMIKDKVLRPAKVIVSK